MALVGEYLGRSQADAIAGTGNKYPSHVLWDIGRMDGFDGTIKRVF